MLKLLNGFIGELRAAGIPVSLTENLDAMTAVREIPLEDRGAFKAALACTLVKNQAHWKAFDTVFEVYFSIRGAEYRIGEDGADDAAREMAMMMEGQEGQPAEGGGLEGLTPKSSPRCSTRRCSTPTTR